jgi:hypothetical protein
MGTPVRARGEASGVLQGGCGIASRELDTLKRYGPRVTEAEGPRAHEWDAAELEAQRDLAREPDEPAFVPFAKLRLEGDRFHDARLPISALVELERYERLVVEAAVARWFADNPNRKNLPRRFRSSFHLVIADVEDGSATPVLERQETTTAYESYYEAGSLDVEAAFKAMIVGDDLSDAYDWAYDSKDFIDFGKSLKTGEAINFHPDDDDAPLRYTPEVREATLSRLGGVEPPPVEEPESVETEGTVAGRLVMMNADTQTFGMRLLGDVLVDGRYEEPERTDDLKVMIGSSAAAPVIRVDGLIRFNDQGVPEEILDAREVELFEVDGEPWSRRFVELATLGEGWNEGVGGSRIEFPALDAARDILSALQRSGRDLPGVFPMEDGGVQLEWASADRVTSVEIDRELHFSLFDLIVDGRRVESLDTGSISEAIDFVLRVTA